MTLSDTSINGWYGDMYFTDGVARFKLKSGQTVSASDIPAGITYSVIEEEANRDGYTTTVAGATGVITGNHISSVEFVNSKGTPLSGVPQTGDTSKSAHWLALMVLSIVGLIGLAIIHKPGRKGRRGHRQTKE